MFSVEPSLELLPESYFHDNGADDAASESGGSDCEEGESIGHTGGAEGVDVPSHGASSVHAVVSPRAASNSRRKRKRKTSQSEKKPPASSKSPSPVSPLEEKQMTFRVNPSPPNPASPISITSPCSPVSALASDCTPRSFTDASCDVSINSNMTTTPTQPSKSTTTSQWISIEKKRRNSNVAAQDSGGGRNHHESLLRANSVPVSDHHQPQERQPEKITTPLSAPGKGTGHCKMIKNEQARTRLMNKFNAMTSHPESVDSKKTENDSNSGNRPSRDNAPRGPWISLSNG